MTTATAPRTERQPPDTLPELISYRDEGCQVWSACLTCPLPVCVEDLTAGRLHRAALARAVLMRQLHAGGWRAPALAERFGVTRRQVYRILQGGT